MFTIENHQVKAVINAKGAELTSLFHKEHQLEYMWDGNPVYWGKHSPVLFPIVGTLKDNTYYYKDKSYLLSRHGFARDRQFAIEDHTGDTITFSLYDDDISRVVFPFSFQLLIRYTLVEHALSVAYEVKNTGKDMLYFSIGAHPAFRLPLVEQTQYEDYFLAFDKEENAPRWPISKDGLIEQTPLPLLQHTDRLPLTKELFRKDALVLKNLNSTIISLRSDKIPHGLQFDFPGFNFLGLWAAPNADFICIEPWCGIADSVNTDQQLVNKEGINKLQPDEEFSRIWTVSLF